MKNTLIFSGLVIASLVAAAAISPIVVAQVIKPFLNLDEVLVRRNPSGLDSIVKTDGVIPQTGISNGQPIAFGYALLTSANIADLSKGIFVSTSHRGVLDSATQNGNANNPVFHNHFITIKNPQGTGYNCGTGALAAVDKVTFASPGQIRIQTTDALQARVPNTFSGPAFGGGTVTASPGNNVEFAFSFELRSAAQGSAVCVFLIDELDKESGLIVR